MQRLIVTGANGAGKSHLAAQLHKARPDVSVVSFDAIKLKTNWQQRPRVESDAALIAELQKDVWILEGGPSLLAKAAPYADGLIWLDPPEYVRAWRLLVRPWKFFGKTRPELPEGNVDWPWQQYRFAWRSLRNSANFRNAISEVADRETELRVFRCRSNQDVEAVVASWVDG